MIPSQLVVHLGFVGSQCVYKSSQSASFGSARVKGCACVTQGLEFVSGLALANCQDLLPMLQWNAAHGIKLMRWTYIAMRVMPWHY